MHIYHPPPVQRRGKPSPRDVVAALRNTARPLFPGIVPRHQLSAATACLAAATAEWLTLTAPGETSTVLFSTVPVCNVPQCHHDHPRKSGSIVGRIATVFIRKYGGRGFTVTDGFLSALERD